MPDIKTYYNNEGPKGAQVVCELKLPPYHATPEAIAKYEEVLKKDSSFEDAQFNLDYLKQMQQQQEQQQQNKNKQEQEDKQQSVTDSQKQKQKKDEQSNKEE